MVFGGLARHRGSVRVLAFYLVTGVVSGIATHAQAGSFGVFGTPATKDVTTTNGVGVPTATDLNGDGYVDFIVANANAYSYALPEAGKDPSTAVDVFLGGPGGLTDATNTGTIYAGAAPRGITVSGIQVADFNRDGKPDVFFSDFGVDIPNPAGGQSHLLLSGDDGLLHETPAATASLGSVQTHDACIADVNGDGAPDVFLSSLGAIGITNAVPSVLAFNDGKGTLTKTTGKLPSYLNTITHFTGSTGADLLDTHTYTGCAFADMNGDGFPDLILGASPNTQNNIILLNDGRGDFTKSAAITLPAGLYGRGYGTPSGATGTIVLKIIPLDLNGDGRLDLILDETNNDKNNGNNIFYRGGKLQILINAGNGIYNDETSVRVTGLDLPQVNQTYIHNVMLANISSATAPDLILNTNSGTGPQSFLILRNDGQGKFSLATDIAGLPTKGFLIPLAKGGSLANSVANIRLDLYGGLNGIGLSNQVVTQYTVVSPQVGAIYSSAQAGSQSFLRFYNTGTTAGVATVTLRNYTTGQQLGKWSSPTIPAGAEQQYAISTIESAVTSGAKPNYYSIAIQSSMSGYFQHVLWRSTDGTLTNLSTCAAGVTADPAKLSGVHSSLVGSGYPSSIVVNNTGAGAAAVTLGVYDARDGTRIGTFTTTAIPAGGQSILTVAAIESGIGRAPTSGLYHYVIKAEGAFSGYLQHLVTNTQAGVVTDMTTECTLGTPGTVSSPSPLRIGAVFSSAQTSSQSFLRFYNTGQTTGTATVTLRDSATGQQLSQWTSPAIAGLSEQQFSIGTVEGAASFTKPAYYSLSVQSTMPGYFQHVLWRSTDGTLTNLSTCAAGVTADAAQLSGVHSSLLAAAYPSSVAVNNTGASASAVTLGVYDARDGSRIGGYTTASIPSNGQVILTAAAIETGMNRAPSSGMYHYVIKAEGAFTGFLQHLVTNQQAGVVTDMTTACLLP